jgi:glycosyltransferase involved in cell wall biosynthesis
VRGRSNVKFTGRIDNVDEYLKASDVFVSASRSEGLPNTVMEALAVGLPVILSDIQPHNEALEYNSNAGFFFPVDDFIALSRILENLRNFSIEELGKASLSIADDHLNADRMSNEYQKKYESLIGKQE